MNYRHAFHAGNFADVMKHAILLHVLDAMQRKDKPLFVLDTHAGPGFTDLAADAPNRTGEWRQGIARLLDAPPPELVAYVELVRSLGLYPGSPALIQARLRADDRLAACELHPEDHAALKRRFAGDARVAVHHRDGYEAVGALLPAARRALVLIDPPYERTDEFARVAAAIRGARKLRPQAVLAAWYPIKHRAPARHFLDGLRCAAIPDIITAEFLLREPTDPARLNGCGLAIVNPPFGAERELPAILAALLARLGNREEGEAATLTRIADE